MHRCALVLCLVVACGDNARPCDYVEKADGENASAAEPTGLTVGVTPRDVCGAIDAGHRDPALGILDEDRYRVTVEGSGELLIELVGDPGAELFDELAVRMFDAHTSSLVAQGRLATALADHAAFIAEVPPGDYDLVVSAKSGGSLIGSLGYRVRIDADPSLRCPAVTASADYDESFDGADSTGNDVVEVDFSRAPSFAPTAASDAPEPTRLAIAAGEAYRLTGTSAAVAHTDQYQDRDTFELSTDATTNELTVRLDWAGAADLDYVVFDPVTLTPVGTATRSSIAVHELETFAVKPSTTYWLWIGRFAGDQGSPIAYDAAICGSHFFH